MKYLHARVLVLRVAVVLSFLLLGFPIASPAASPADSSKNPTRLLAHYMPWYEAKPVSPHWGWHWTMNAFDPEKKSDGKPEIASHYHPLIGPYDSGDADVLEYHVLLMMLAGIDGVIVDWYGREEYLDHASVHRHTAKLRDQIGKMRLQFAVCYEDQTIPKLVAAGRLKENERVKHAREDIAWLQKNWFESHDYLKLDGKPVLLSFGRDGLSDAEWEQALKDLPAAPLYLSEHHRRTAATGAFDWPVPQVGIKAHDGFLVEARAARAMAVAFPRFHDIYEQAKIHKSWGTIPDEKGKTFESTLENAVKSGLPLVQISTWNDWGEGTIIEPSVEFGYRDLEVIQRLRKTYIDPNFSHTAEDLRIPLRIFRLRKSVGGALERSQELDKITGLLADHSTKPAREALDRLEGSVFSTK